MTLGDPLCTTCGKKLGRYDGCQCIQGQTKRADEEQSLTRQLVEHPRWEWRAQMRADHPPGHPDHEMTFVVEKHMLTSRSFGDYLPVLDDHATQGILLQMLIEVVDTWKDGYSITFWDSRRYPRDGVEVGPDIVAPTYGEALAQALLEAWKMKEGKE